jgi:hypothetical protein
MPLVTEGSFELEVTTPGSFLVSVLPALLSVAQGAVATYQVKIVASGGYTGPVALSIPVIVPGGLPAGAVVTFDKTQLLPGETAVMTITTTALPKNSHYAQTVRGTEVV